MPSGAKKRKAAKKKQLNQSNNPAHLNAGDESGVGENRWPKSEGEGDEIAEGSRVKSDEKHVEVVESEDDEKHEHDGGSSQSGSSNSDDETQGGVKDAKAESSIDSTKVDAPVSIEATCNSPIDDSVVGEKIAVLIEQVEVHNEQSPSDINVDAVQSAIKENGEKKFATSVEEKISSSLERTVDLSDSNPTNNTKSEDPRECVKQELDDTTALQHNALQPNSGVKNSVVVQPVLPPLSPGEKTSWKSCCGIFEVFTRSAA